MKENKFEAGALKRVGVVAIFFVLISLVVMGWLSHNDVIKFDFIIPWAAFWGVMGGVSSWIYTNLIRAYSDSARLSDARKEKLADLAAEIIEKTHQVHRAIRLIASERSSDGEIEQAREKYGVRKEDGYDEEGIVFHYRYDQMEEVFEQYWGVDIKVRIYFGDEVEKIIRDLKSIINSIRVDISRINRSHGPYEDKSRAEKIKESIWSLYAGEISPENRGDKRSAQRVEKFKNIPERIEQALLKYVQES